MKTTCRRPLMVCAAQLVAMLCWAAATPKAKADITATYTAATDVGATAASYTASGTATLALGYAPVTGTNLTVVKNTGLGFITGTFSNLAQGQAVALSYGGLTYQFVANYYGGTGNDLMLQWASVRPLAWGYNLFGQLGNNSTAQSNVPAAVLASGVLAGKTVVAVSAGVDHSMALCANGTVAAWGWNGYGELGNNSTTNSPVPVAVNTDSGTSALYGKTVVAVAAGYVHSVALCSDGTVAAWGWNVSGQLGNNSWTDSRVPVAVNTASGTSALSGKTVVAVAAGYGHSVALCADGMVAAWGFNRNGELGNNSTTDSNVPVAVNTASGTSALFGKTVVAVAAGYQHSVALCSDGTVAAWGYNVFDQLGNNSQTNSQVPVAVNTASGTSALFGKTVVAVAAGGYHSLALCADGTVAAWGYNSNGRLGNNSTTNSPVPVAVNTDSGTSVLFGKTVVAVSAGNSHSVALCADGTMAAWGFNNTGQLGNNSATDSMVPVAVSTSALAAGERVTLVGSGSSASHTLALAAAPPLIGAITATYTSACDVPVTVVNAILSGGTATLALGYAPVTGTNLTVVKNTGLGFITGTFSNLAQGQAVALSYGGLTYQFVANYYGGTGNDLVLQWANVRPLAWGSNSRGQLGNNSTTDSHVPTPVLASGVLAGRTVVAVAAGLNHSVALCSDGTVAAWGYNFYGQLGNNSTTDSPVPVAVNTASGTSALYGKTVVAVAAGAYHSVALCSDGTVAAWGWNDFGQLGNNSTTDSPVPVAVNTDSGTSALYGKTVVAVAAGGAHSVALCSDGTVAAWGYNTSGQLGNNSQTDSHVPVAVNRDSGTSALFGKTVVAVTAGNGYSVALCSDGTVAAWGHNFGGELGNNSQTDSLVPVAVNTASGTSALFGKTVVAVAAGGYHSVALCSDGTVAAWGRNTEGELGDNSQTNSLVPVAVNTASGTSALFGKTVVAVAAGHEHSVALCSDGTVAAWGWNVFGQLGNNSTTQNQVPVAVSTTPLANGERWTLAGSGAVADHTLALAAVPPVPIVATPTSTTITSTGATLGGNVTGEGGAALTARGLVYAKTADNANPTLGGANVTVVADAANTTGVFSETITGLATGTGYSFVAYATNSVGTSYTTPVSTFSTPAVGSLAATFNAATDVPVTSPSVTIGGSSTVTLILGYAPVTGTNLTVVKNTGLGFITGTFSNLAQGQAVALSFGGVTYDFVANYYGGTGNDLVLQWASVRPLAWGYNGQGQLGNNSTANSTVPTAVLASGVLAGKTVVAVSAGADHSVALCADGTVAAWGNNSLTQSPVPVVVNTDSGTSALSGKTVVAVAAGTYHSVALCSDGTVAAWGFNEDGELGNNSTTDSLVPVAVNTDSGTSALSGKTVVAVAAGQYHSVALCSDGTVAAWGYNFYHQLGNNSTTASPVPVAVNMASGTSALFGKTVVAVAAGANHSVALCSDGTVAAWGFNSDGELGNNSTTDSPVPVTVNTASGTSALSGKTVVAVAAGQFHSVALCSDGTVAAWGDNYFGQLGNNSTTDSPVPVAVNTASGTSALFGKTVVAVAAGANHSVALCADGTLAAWGYNREGELGNNSTTASPVPVAVSTSALATGERVTLIGTGSQADHTLALAAAPPLIGAITATYTSAGDVPVTFPNPMLSGGTATLTLGYAPEVGTNLTLVKNTGLGFITGTFSNLAQGQAVALSFGGVTYDFVANYYGGSGNDLVLQWAHVRPLAWGRNDYGGLGNNSTTDSHVPAPVLASGVLAGKRLVAVAAGQFHSVALCSDGTVAAWGWNIAGQLGNNNGGTDSPVPVAVNTTSGTSALFGKTVVAVTAGQYHSVALCSDGTVAAWGNSEYGQLGSNILTGSRVPVAVNTDSGTSALYGKTVVAVSAGVNHSVALCSDGTVATWGKNDFGQLGNNSTTKSPVPVAVNTASGRSALFGKTVVAVAAGANHCVALCSDGTMAAWGFNLFGQLGNNSTTNSLVPVAVNTAGGTSALVGKTVVAVAAGGVHSVALCADGTVAAWGYNGDGRLGNNSTTDSHVPVAVNTDSGTSALSGKTVVAVAVGAIHSVALCADGTMAAWGYNGNGQLGNNSMTDSPVPVSTTPLAAPERVTLVGSGSMAYHTLALAAVRPIEIAVSGNGMNIAAGESTPSTADDTDFGSATVINGQVAHTFTISNGGYAVLNLTGTPLVTLSGPDAAAFTVRLAPAASVAAEQSTRFSIVFDPTLPGPCSATVTIVSNDPAHPSYSFAISGYGTLPALRPQTLTFAPPATVFLNQSPLNLSAYASSGLPVTLSIVPTGTTAAGATLTGGALSFTGAGIIKVQAVQAGDGLYAATATVVKTITVKANPTALNLLNLTQTYDGTAKPIATTGGTGTPVITYKLGTTTLAGAPINAGSYAVTAVAGTATVNGTLVIAKAPLYVTPDDKHKFVGQDNPAPLTLTYSGFVNGGTQSLVTTAPVLKTTAAKTSVGGVYPITASGGVVSANYALIYQQGSLVVDSFSSNYEALLSNAGDVLIGKLTITGAAANTSFTGKLYCADEKAALALTGKLVSDPAHGLATGSVTVLSNNVSYGVNFTAHIDGSLTASVTRLNGIPYASSNDGRRLLTLATGKKVLYAGAHTAVLEPATPTSSTVPVGAGWATASIGTNGVLALAGQLGDGTKFTAALSPDDLADPGYRLWVQPYLAARTGSYLAGGFTLAAHPSLTNRRYVQASTLTWKKIGQSTDATNRAGFGPVATVMMLDPWLPTVAATKTVAAVTLAQRLGLTGSPAPFSVAHGATGSAADASLPTGLGLSSIGLVSVVAPVTIPVNSTKWKATFTAATGVISGSFELADPGLVKGVVTAGAQKRTVPFTGILRQPASAADTLIGDGNYLLPPLIGAGTEKLAGEVMFQRP